MEACKKAVKIKPDFADAHLHQGFVYGRVGLYQAAVEAFKQAVKIKPFDSGAHYLLGRAYIDINAKSAACEEYKILKNLDSELAQELFQHINKGI